MLGLLLILVLIGVAVAVFLALGTILIQGYLYSQPVEGVVWRSAAAGATVAAFFGMWCWLEATSPGRYDTLLSFSPRETLKFDKFWSERTGDRGKQEVLYTRGGDDRGRVVYSDPDRRPWQRSGDGSMVTAIIVEENGEKRRFEAEMDKGTFKIDAGQPLRYVESDGRRRVMTDDAVGELSTTRYGLLFGNLLLNLAHLVVWFLCLWMLMEFQWPHALGLAAALCVTFSLLVWPVLQRSVPHIG
jgi:hypothetical protein